MPATPLFSVSVVFVLVSVFATLATLHFMVMFALGSGAVHFAAFGAFGTWRIWNMAQADDLRPPAAMVQSGDLAIGWLRWIERYDFYIMATEKNNKPGSVQVAILLTLMGSDAIDIYRTFEWANAADKDNIDSVKSKFEAYFAPRKNVTYERYTFMRRHQRASEPFDTFLTDLKNLISTCEYHPEERANLLRDQIVLETVSDSVRDKLFYADGGELNLTLAVEVDICRNSEIKGQLMENVSGDAKIDKLHVMKMPKNAKPKKKSNDGAQTDGSANQWKCKYCGQQHKPRQCPAYGNNCNKCGKPNHFASCCLANKSSRTTADMLTETSNKTGIVDTVETEVKREWFEKLDVEGHNLKMKIDTGASCNVMSVETYKALCNDKLKKAKTKLESYGGHKLKIAGKWCCVGNF